MTVNICSFVRQEVYVECPECKEEFRKNEVSSQATLLVKEYEYTLAPCPRCNQIVAIDVVEKKGGKC